MKYNQKALKYNQKVLKKRICKDYICFEFFARCMGTSTEHLFAMLQGVEDWTQPEIEKAASLLHLQDEEIQPLFFTLA